MDQLLFFGFIIFISILESIARSRRAKKQKEQGEVRGEDPRYEFEWAQKSPDDLPTYDADPSYDDMPSYDDAVEEDVAPRAPVRDQRPSTESMLPGNLFEELAALANQLEVEKEKAQTVRVPKQSPPLPESQTSGNDWLPTPSSSRPAPRPVRTRRSEAVTRAKPTRGTPRPPHRVHDAHRYFGTDPSERPPPIQDGMDPLRETLSEDAKAVREQLTSQSTSALRQAFILKEVLGTPVGLQE
ncbi:MAG: hypothetical protein AAF389_20260 [Gemmatimonadota bacterium]